MTNPQKISFLIEYKNWAESHYIKYIQDLKDEQFKQRILGKSIQEILFHIIEVMQYWYNMINDDEIPLNLTKSSSKEEMITEYTRINQLITSYANEDRYYEFEEHWDESHVPVKTNSNNVLINYVIHSAYHRGQLALLLRELGHESIRETDFNPWIYDKEQSYD